LAWWLRRAPRSTSRRCTSTGGPICGARRGSRCRERADIEAREDLVSYGRLVDVRERLLRVLAHRALTASGEDATRLAACMDIAALQRRHDRAIDAPRAAEARN
jgi:hypothetical protein